MDLQLTGKRALISGGSGGIGRAIARQLALEGARVAIASRNAERCAAAAAAIAGDTGAEILAAQVDTGDTDSVDRLIETVTSQLGGLDILVNCAARVSGDPTGNKLAGITDEMFWDDMNVKVMGYIRTCRAAAPHMIAQGWGRIINIAGLRARLAFSAIGSIRNVSVAAMTKNFADELGPHGINVTVVHPGYTHTEENAELLASMAKGQGVTEEEVLERMAANSIGRIVHATEVADVVAFLASPRSGAITGDAIAVGGGSPGAIHY